MDFIDQARSRKSDLQLADPPEFARIYVQIEHLKQTKSSFSLLRTF